MKGFGAKGIEFGLERRDRGMSEPSAGFAQDAAHAFDKDIGDVRDQGEGHGDSMACRDGLEGLPCDGDADKDKHRSDGCDGNPSMKKIHQSEDRDQKKDETDRECITAASAEAFVSGMSDVYGGRERPAKQRAGHRSDAVHPLAGSDRIVIARSFGTFDVVHGFDEVVDLDRDDRQKQRGELHKQQAQADDQVVKEWKGQM